MFRMNKLNKMLILYFLLFLLTNCTADKIQTEHEGVSPADTQAELQSAAIASGLDSAPR